MNSIDLSSDVKQTSLLTVAVAQPSSRLNNNISTIANNSLSGNSAASKKRKLFDHEFSPNKKVKNGDGDKKHSDFAYVLDGVPRELKIDDDLFNSHFSNKYFVERPCKRNKKYLGFCKDGRPHGKGVLVEVDGCRREGEFSNGLLVKGKAKIIYDDGAIYEGDMINDKCNGHGITISPNGDFCDGKYEDNQFITGQTKTTIEGGVFEGIIERNKTPGPRRVKFIDGKILFDDGTVYNGSFLNNLPHGAGELCYLNGTIITGYFESNLNNLIIINIKSFNGDVYSGQAKKINYTKYVPHGTGEMLFACGDVFDGEFVNGNTIRMQGNHQPSKNKFFENSLQLAQFTGNGRIFYKNRNIYSGGIAKGIPHGKGSMRVASGEISYAGDFQQGDKTGRGEMSWENGTYSGEVLLGKPHGQGRVMFDDLRYYIAEFNQGNLT